MVWFRLDDDWPFHPKVIRAGKDARQFHCICGCYCGKYLTDGFIADSALAMLGAVAEVDPEVCAEKLVEVEMWERGDGGYHLHDFLEYNPSRAEVEAKRAARASAGRKGGLAKARANAKAIATAGATPVATPACLPPTRPVPSLKEEDTETAQYTKIVSFCESMFGIRNELLQQYINQRVDDYGLNLTLWAVQTAYEANARTWRYVDACLENKTKERSRAPPSEFTYHDPFLRQTITTGKANAGSTE